MGTIAVILLVLGVLLLLPGLFIKAVELLIWIGLAFAAVAVILWVIDWFRGRKNTRV